MLKSFVQLFAETFIKSKKYWISEQSSCSTSATNINVPDKTPVVYVPPKNGYILIGGDGANSCNVGIRDLSRIQTVLVNEQGFLQTFLPVCKGASIRLYCETKDGSSLTAKFFPQIGAV